MVKISVRVKVPFGEMVVEAERAEEILAALRSIPPEFIGDIDALITMRLTSPMKTVMHGIIELTTEGPVITTREKLTHYESIGLVLFASERQTNTAAKISRLLASSGIRSMVPARLNEMTKRGIVFKPDPSKPKFKLTAQGERWIEEEVLVKLRETISKS